MKFGVAFAVLCGLLSTRALALSQQQTLDLTYPSAALTAFWGSPVSIRAEVLLPDSYYRDPEKRYPTIYVIPAFNADFHFDPTTEKRWQGGQRALHSEFIVIMLGAMVVMNGEGIHQEFADSANDGPWGAAFTGDFIPAADRQFRTLAAPDSRFLFGHSSGGWSALWLQVNYPDLFGGAWALSPDPVDFHNFFGPDLTTNPPQNFYTDARGTQYGINFVDGYDRSTIRDYAVRYEWMRRQLDTYDDVFSPRGPGGAAERLFDRKSGAIDANVAAYWEAHYDITHLLQERWSSIGPKLVGKLHVYVGDEDTFHLNGSVHLMKDALAKLGANAEIEFMPGANHWDIYNWHGDVVAYAMSEMNARSTASAATSAP
jgi:S-formylglutathione hydrolase FrmB